MGYSHHWQVAPDAIDNQAWAALCEDAKLLFQASPVWLCFGAYEPAKPPLVNPRMIRFNGREPDAYEDFVLTPKPTRRWQSCKTGQRPYDMLVCAVLAAARDRSEAISVETDATPEDWRPHLAWASRVLQRTLRHPVVPAITPAETWKQSSVVSRQLSEAISAN